MIIQHHISLKPYNSFGIDAQAHTFVTIDSEEALQAALLAFKDQPKFILGGGSNLLLQRDLHEVVLHINLKGLKILETSDDEVVVQSMAGENWHEFVLWTLQNDFGGLENLSLIPGNVGTTPVQNIGAYGVEIKDHMIACEGYKISDGSKHVFSTSQCTFGYRDSIFKSELKDKFIITAVRFKLTKNNHQLRTSYGAIEAELQAKGISHPTIQDISEAVISIRSSKLPDPKVLGNSGSFFKNPVVPHELVSQLLESYPEMPHFAVDKTHTKVPAGWLIEQTGYKGKRISNAGMHKNQALVLVNYGNATGAELWQVAQEVQQKVYQKFGIALEPEVNVIR